MANVKHVLGLLVGVSLCAVPAAQAQTDGTERLFVGINFGQQMVPDTRQLQASLAKFPIYQETATVTSQQTVASGPVFDLGVSYRVWKNLGVGIVAWRYADTETATTSSRVPDPIFFARPRIVDGTVADLKRTELGAALVLSWNLQLGNRLSVAPGVGFAFIKVQQDLISDFTVAPAGTQNVNLTTTTVKPSGSAPYVGVDGTFMIVRHLGVGGYVRFAKAKVDIGDNLDSEIGGVQAGGGVRLRF